MQEELTGEVLRITYQNPENAFTVAKLNSPKHSRETTAVGTMPLIQVGQIIRCQGSWVLDRRHGKQFSVQSFSFELPSNPASIERLLCSGYLKGVGPVYGAKIAKAFGTKTFDILDHEPEKLYTVEGIGRKRADQIIECWKNRTQLQEVLILLCNWGITQSQSLKIIKRWGNKALQTIRENPYQLAKDIHGIGFLIADKIAERLEIPKDSTIRIDAAVEFFLWELSTEGHTCAPLNNFIELSSEKLQIDREQIKNRIDELFRAGALVLFKPRPESEFHIALKPLFAYEQRIAMHMRRLSTNGIRLRTIDIEKAIDWASQTLNMSFAPLQRQAIASALSTKFSVITGGPGTGKSTITKAIVAITSKLTSKIMLVAPTGRAAKRLQEVTGHYAQTIHRLLKFNPATAEFTHDSHNPLNCDLIIIDESSMVDTPLTAALLDAIPNYARCLFIGDSDQLPSVGPGNVLKDTIDSLKIPTICLTEIFRQAAHSLIIKNAHRINAGQMPLLCKDKGDFRFLSVQEPEQIRLTTLKLVTKELPAAYGFDPRRDIQVLIPMRRGDCGIDRFNTDLQNHFIQEHQKSGHFAIGDKVIQLKNNYQKEVYNGDIGFICHIDDSHTLTVEFDNKTIEYDPTERDELSLAWAISIHKFQGSECPCVILPIHTQHFKLLNKNLLYTAVTRGKRLVILVGSTKAVAIAVHTANTQQRWTNLNHAIFDHFTE